MKLSQGLIKI